VSLIAAGRLFHARDAATGNERKRYDVYNTLSTTLTNDADDYTPETQKHINYSGLNIRENSYPQCITYNML